MGTPALVARTPVIGTPYSLATICALPLLAGPPWADSISEATPGLYANAVLRRSGRAQVGGVGALTGTANLRAYLRTLQ